ncbi:TMEM175 family protein [Epilithonimonas sp. UC225_85]|uniref:TMEM175 family protein n=1 Tax=Epilithonimonas sp. UC225_85 TaxID=3350167 RepID=UPI0036D31B7D
MEKNTARLEAFSDGIFGVAITLLALEIGIQEYQGANNLNLLERIIEKWPEYFTYFNSFATVLLIWMGHNKIFEQLKKSNHWLIFLNGFVLLLVVLFPFPTKVVGSFIGTAAQETAVAFYAGFTGFITLSMLLLNLVIVNNKSLLISPEKSIPWLKNMIKGQVLGFIVYEATAVLAFYYSAIALIITFLMWILWAVISMDKNEHSIDG